MILFSFPDFAQLATGVGVPQGVFQATRFDNGEWFIELDRPVEGEDCVILGSIAPPDGQLLSTMLLADTLHRRGARGITGIFPYLAYLRQDKDKPEQSLAAAWVGEMARASGFDRVVTIDVHSAKDERLFPIPLISISPAAIFGEALTRYQLTGASIIAPDHGAIARCEAIRAAAGLSRAPVAWFEKQRSEAGIHHTRFTGEVGEQALLVDDILDTGATLVSACQRLLCAGVEDIQIMVTHGLFTGTDWESLWELGVSRIFCLDTIPARAAGKDARIVTLPSAPLLAETLVKLFPAGSESAGRALEPSRAFG